MLIGILIGAMGAGITAVIGFLVLVVKMGDYLDDVWPINRILARAGLQLVRKDKERDGQ